MFVSVLLSSLVKLTGCLPLASNQANCTQPGKWFSYSDCGNYYLTESLFSACCWRVCVLIIVRVWPALPRLKREILIAPSRVAHGNQCLICRLLDKGFNAGTCPHRPLHSKEIALLGPFVHFAFIQACVCKVVVFASACVCVCEWICQGAIG